MSDHEATPHEVPGDSMYYEMIPGGGVRVCSNGIELTVPGEAIERAEQEGGLGFNIVLSREVLELIVPSRHEEVIDDCPIEALMDFHVAVTPSNPDREALDE